MKNWHSVKLGQALHKSEDWIDLEPDREYKEVTVRLWGKGAVLRGISKGAEIAADRRLAVREGQLILSRIDARNGALGIVPASLDGAIVSNDFPAFTVERSLALPEFLGWLVKTGSFVELCKSASEGTTNRVRLKEEKFLDMPVSLPSPDEQRHIVARIEELAAKIEGARILRQHALEENEAFWRSSVSSLYLDGPVWRTVQDTVKNEKGSVRSGPFGSQLLHEEFIDRGVAAIGSRDVQTNRFELRGGWFVTPEKFEEFKRYQVFPRDLLCTIVGGSIGRFCVVPEEVPLAFTTKHVQALTLDQKKADPHFVSYMLNFNRRCRESLFSKVEGSAQPSLNAGKILTTQLPVPPPDEQRRVVAYLDGLQQKVNSLRKTQEETAEELAALMPSILSKAFSGEL